MEPDDVVHFGCLRCKRTRRTQEIDEQAEQVMLQVLEAAFYLIETEGERQGVTVPSALREKLMKWAVKQSIIPADAEKRRKLRHERNQLD